MGSYKCFNWGQFVRSCSSCLLTAAQVTKNFAGIMVCRVFIGLPEVKNSILISMCELNECGFPQAAFYPGIMFLLSRWYTKKVNIMFLES